MTHDWMMRCARQFGGSRDAALVCPHRGPSCGSRVPRPNARAVCHAARCCAALCGIAKPAPRCFQDPSWIPVQKQEGKHHFTQSITFGSSKIMAPKLDNAFLQEVLCDLTEQGKRTGQWIESVTDWAIHIILSDWGLCPRLAVQPCPIG